MNRRSFLKHSAHSLAATGALSGLGFTIPSGKSFASLLKTASESDRVLVLIYLDGGNDGLNTVVPLDRLSELNTLRSHVVLNEDELIRLPGSQVGLHPALTAFEELYNENRLQIFQNVGYPDQNFSHFRSTDIWMSGSDANEVVTSGWSGRYVEGQYPGYPDDFPSAEMEDPLSVEIGYGSSLLFQGVASSMSVTLNSVDSFYELVDNIEQEAPDSPAGDKLRFVRLIARQSQLYGERIVDVASNVTNHVAYPTNNYLADQLKVVSKLIAGGSRTPLYLVRLGGFDTHDSQVESGNHAEGEHATLLRMLNDGVSAFVKDLEYHGVDDKVLGMTFSEFGRRIVSNASFGTDHGSAAPMFFFGNALKGGVNGSNPEIDSQMSYGDNLDYEFDFRQLYGSVLEQWFDVDASTRSNVLFNDFETVELIGEPSLLLNTNEPKAQPLVAYPNPLNGTATVDFLSDGNEVSIQLVDVQGKLISKVYEGRSTRGTNSLRWDTSTIPQGRYFLMLQSANRREVFSVIK